MNSLAWLQAWYAAQCNGDWEHQYGMVIQTLDNPGWSVTVDLAGTSLEGRSMQTVSTGTNVAHAESHAAWLHCQVKHNRFEGAGGPLSLFAICEVFRRWVEEPSSAGVSIAGQHTTLQ